MKVCPKCGGTKFLVTAHVTQDWVVDENGNFLECIDECSEVTHHPGDDDLWHCVNCGYNALASDPETADVFEFDQELSSYFRMDGVYDLEDEK